MADTTFEVTAKSFSEFVERDGIVVLDWWAPWCGPCRAFAPTFESIAQRHPDIAFGKVNTEQEADLAASHHIRSIPTLMILRDRVMLYSQPGALPGAALEDLLQQARALDMGEVRAKIAAHERQGQAPGAA